MFDEHTPDRPSDEYQTWNNKRLSLIEQRETLYDRTSDDLIDRLVSAPQESRRQLLAVIKAAVRESLPVTSETRRYATRREIVAGARLRTDVYEQLDDLYDRLMARLIKRLPKTSAANDDLLAQAQVLDKRVFNASPIGKDLLSPGESPNRLNGNEEKWEAYRKMISDFAALLGKIDPNNEAQKKVLNFALQVINRYSTKGVTYNDRMAAEEEARVIVAEDVFLQLLPLLGQSTQSAESHGVDTAQMSQSLRQIIFEDLPQQRRLAAELNEHVRNMPR